MKSLTSNLFWAHYNHECFWDVLSPISRGGGVEPEKGSNLEVVIKQSFGKIDSLKNDFTNKALELNGAGWTWLVYNKPLDKLEVYNTKENGRIGEENPLL